MENYITPVAVILTLIIGLTLTLKDCEKSPNSYQEAVQRFENTYGKPKYEVILLNSFKDTIEIKYAHHYKEKWNLGPNINFIFTYYGYKKTKTSSLVELSRDRFSWDKRYVIINKINYGNKI